MSEFNNFSDLVQASKQGKLSITFENMKIIKEMLKNKWSVYESGGNSALFFCLTAEFSSGGVDKYKNISLVANH